MVTVIKNATVVTGDAGRTILYDHALAIVGDTIDGVGPTEEIVAAHRDAEVIDARGKALFPGLINCHTHLLATVDRGILEDFGFPTRLRFPVTARSLLTQEERQTMAVLGALEAIRSGTTSLLEISGNVAEYGPHLERTGLRLTLAENINDVDPEILYDHALAIVGDTIDGVGPTEEIVAHEGPQRPDLRLRLGQR